MQLVQQISIFIENRPGRLTKILNLFQEHQIDIRSMSVADTKDFGILRLIVNHSEAALAALKEAGYAVTVTEVIAIGIEDKPGGLTSVMTLLSDAGMNVEYFYAFVSPKVGQAFVILRVDDNDGALAILQEHQIPVLTPEDFR